MNLRNIAKSLIKYPLFNQIIIHRKYNIEKKLLRGVNIATSNSNSLIHFTFNKAASQYIKSLLVVLAKENNLIQVGFNDYAFYSALPFLDHLNSEEMDKYQHLFRSQGFLYSAFGGMINGVNFENFKILLTVRDPRDILVSSYYSAAYSHEIPPTTSSKRDNLLNRRQQALGMSIDDYVLKESENVFQKFQYYKSHLLEKYPQTKLLSYELMVSDFPSWLDKLEELCGYNFSNQTKKDIIKRQKDQVKTENLKAQKRKGVIGDYNEKLKDDTIDFLNNNYEKELKAFGYL